MTTLDLIISSLQNLDQKVFGGGPLYNSLHNILRCKLHLGATK